MFNSLFSKLHSTSSSSLSVADLEHLSLAVFGGLVLYVLTRFTIRYFLRPVKNFRRKYGSYAIITGATDGIGKALAFELAGKHGLNLILISRTESKLQEVQRELQSKYSGREVQIHAMDFSAIEDKDLNELQRLITQYEVGLLVNSVGLSYSYPEWFHSLSRDTVRDLINLNITSTTLLSHLILPEMVKRRRGCIVNLSSAASVIPSPLLAEYGAAKAYINKLTESLAVEYKPLGIDIQAQYPLYVATKMAKMRPSLQVPTAQQFARASIRAYGYESTISPYWVHALMLGVLSRVPRFVSNQYILGMHKSIRARALKKQAAKKQ